MNRTTQQKMTPEDNAKSRPIINYKLKDNPFFEKKQDTKKEPDSNSDSNKNVTPATSKSGVTKKTWSPSNTSDRKQVRASVQKMASSSTVSSNPWKSQQIATTARKPPTMARKTSIVKKPSLLKKEADEKRQPKEESPPQNRILANSFSQPQPSSTVAKKKTSNSSLRSTGSSASASSKKSDSLSTGEKRLSSAKTPATTATSTTTSTTTTVTTTVPNQVSKTSDKADARIESITPSASTTTSKTVPTPPSARKQKQQHEQHSKADITPSNHPSSSSSSTSPALKKPATSVSSIAKALHKETPAQPSPIRPPPSMAATLQQMVDETEKEFTSSSSGRTSASSSPSSQSDYETLDDIKRDDHATTPFTPPSISPKDKEHDLPWGEFAPATPNKQQSVAMDTQATACDTEAMQRQLAVSHAVLTSLDFPTLSMDEAERLHKKHARAKTGLTKIRDQMLLETHMQRSMLSLIKFSGPHQDILQLQDSTKSLDQLAQELYYTASDACESQKHYFQHLAGTLANTVQQEQDDTWESGQSSSHQNQNSQPQHRAQQQQQQQQKVLRQQRDAIRELRTEQEQLLTRLDTLVKAYAPSSSHSSYPAGTGSLSDDESASLSDESLLFSKSVRTSLTSIDDDRRPLHPVSLATQLIDSLEHQLQRMSQSPSRAPPAPAAASSSSSVSLADTQKLQEQQKRISDLEAKLADSERKRQALEQREAAWQADQKTIISKCRYALADESSLDTAVTLVQRLVERNDTAMRCVNDLEHQLEEQTTREAELVQQVEAAQDRATAAEAKAHAEIHEAHSTPAAAAPTPSPPQETASSQDVAKLEALFRNAQEEFTRREAALMLQSASVEAELGAILKEYDRLTRNITDFHNERKKHQTKELAWTRERQRLEKQLADFTIRDKLGVDGQSMTLRREFRQLMATVKSEHQQELEKEMEGRRQLEAELRDMKHDLELKRWDKVDAAVQTPFVAYYHQESHPLH